MSEQRAFNWVYFDNISIPYLIRSGENYVSLHMLQFILLKTYVRPFSLCEITNCIDFAILAVCNMTHTEMVVLTDVNFKFSNKLFGFAFFKLHRELITLTQARQMYNFSKFCYETLLKNRSITEKYCGFIKINTSDKTIRLFLPYVWFNMKQYVPLFYLDGELNYLETRAIELKSFELAYLKFLCKIHGISKKLYDKNSVIVVDLEYVKNMFLPDTSFDNCWPNEVYWESVLKVATKVISREKEQQNVTKLQTTSLTQSHIKRKLDCTGKGNTLGKKLKLLKKNPKVNDKIVSFMKSTLSKELRSIIQTPINTLSKETTSICRMAENVAMNNSYFFNCTENTAESGKIVQQNKKLSYGTNTFFSQNSMQQQLNAVNNVTQDTWSKFKELHLKSTNKLQSSIVCKRKKGNRYLRPKETYRVSTELAETSLKIDKLSTLQLVNEQTKMKVDIKNHTETSNESISENKTSKCLGRNFSQDFNTEINITNSIIDIGVTTSLEISTPSTVPADSQSELEFNLPIEKYLQTKINGNNKQINNISQTSINIPILNSEVNNILQIDDINKKNCSIGCSELQTLLTICRSEYDKPADNQLKYYVPKDISSKLVPNDTSKSGYPGLVTEQNSLKQCLQDEQYTNSRKKEHSEDCELLKHLSKNVSINSNKLIFPSETSRIKQKFNINYAKSSQINVKHQLGNNELLRLLTTKDKHNSQTNSNDSQKSTTNKQSKGNKPKVNTNRLVNKNYKQNLNVVTNFIEHAAELQAKFDSNYANSSQLNIKDQEGNSELLKLLTTSDEPNSITNSNSSLKSTNGKKSDESIKVNNKRVNINKLIDKNLQNLKAVRNYVEPATELHVKFDTNYKNSSQQNIHQGENSELLKLLTTKDEQNSNYSLKSTNSKKSEQNNPTKTKINNQRVNTNKVIDKNLGNVNVITIV